MHTDPVGSQVNHSFFSTSQFVSVCVCITLVMPVPFWGQDSSVGRASDQKARQNADMDSVPWGHRDFSPRVSFERRCAFGVLSIIQPSCAAACQHLCTC